MSHLDDAALAALALGDGTQDDAAHVAECGVCADALAEYTRLTESLGSIDQAPRMETPPAYVWAAIASETAADARLSNAAGAPDTVGEAGAGDSGGDELAARRERRSSRPSWWALTAAAAAGVVIGGVGVSAVSGGDERSAEVVASAPLSQLQTESSAGTADVEVLDDGTRVLVVETDYDELVDAYYEVWLIDENIEGMVSLGHLTGDTTEFTLPEGFDITVFPIVDISIEPVDGIPTHSGDSVTRGILDL
ncbi:anti-sigma factor [Demequina flava]|uniref:anti-sigma factor n=1 Tax=Demequina flava TaxID=1095025 RepID=UPI0007846DE3|nr:anti-sigma factor [Demequina flava]